ncbi:MAG TPA: hypothetical protein VHR66_18175 [Gemmataceae bacterium]|nr:hypothetical protein [Gemmataceae bacterium]
MNSALQTLVPVPTVVSLEATRESSLAFLTRTVIAWLNEQVPDTVKV